MLVAIAVVTPLLQLYEARFRSHRERSFRCHSAEYKGQLRLIHNELRDNPESFIEKREISGHDHLADSIGSAIAVQSGLWAIIAF
jgi:hypothetical protein